MGPRSGVRSLHQGYILCHGGFRFGSPSDWNSAWYTCHRNRARLPSVTLTDRGLELADLVHERQIGCFWIGATYELITKDNNGTYPTVCCGTFKKRNNKIVHDCDNCQTPLQFMCESVPGKVLDYGPLSNYGSWINAYNACDVVGLQLPTVNNTAFMGRVEDSSRWWINEKRILNYSSITAKNDDISLYFCDAETLVYADVADVKTYCIPDTMSNISTTKDPLQSMLHSDKLSTNMLSSIIPSTKLITQSSTTIRTTLPTTRTSSQSSITSTQSSITNSQSSITSSQSSITSTQSSITSTQSSIRNTQSSTTVLSSVTPTTHSTAITTSTQSTTTTDAGTIAPPTSVIQSTFKTILTTLPSAPVASSKKSITSSQSSITSTQSSIRNTQSSTSVLSSVTPTNHSTATTTSTQLTTTTDAGTIAPPTSVIQSTFKTTLTTLPSAPVASSKKSITSSQSSMTSTQSSIRNTQSSTSVLSSVTPKNHSTATTTSTQLTTTTDAGTIAPPTSVIQSTFKTTLTTLPSAPVASSNRPHVTLPPVSRTCFTCGDSTPDICEIQFQEAECPPPNNYCMNIVTNSLDGSRTMERKCSSFDDCYTNWWQGSSDEEMCQKFTTDISLTADFQCFFCCIEDNCNSDVKPPYSTLYRDQN